MNTRQQENGSVIVYILIAIALIAALSYAISRGSRSSEATLTGDQARIAASSIIEYTNSVATAVQKLLLRGCDETEINFENNIYGVNYTNSNSPSDRSCHVFDTAGGAITPLVPDKSWLITPTSIARFDFLGSNTVEGVGGNGPLNVASSADLIVLLPNLSRMVCETVNEKLGHNFSSPPTETAAVSPNPFLGIYAASGQIRDGAATNIDGKLSICIDFGADNYTDYVFYQVLIARN